jgi:hypothetical protein
MDGLDVRAPRLTFVHGTELSVEVEVHHRGLAKYTCWLVESRDVEDPMVGGETLLHTSLAIGPRSSKLSWML